MEHRSGNNLGCLFRRESWHRGAVSQLIQQWLVIGEFHHGNAARKGELDLEMTALAKLHRGSDRLKIDHHRFIDLQECQPESLLTKDLNEEGFRQRLQLHLEFASGGRDALRRQNLAVYRNLQLLRPMFVGLTNSILELGRIRSTS